MRVREQAPRIVREAERHVRIVSQLIEDARPVGRLGLPKWAMEKAEREML